MRPHESLEVWETAVDFVVKIYKATETFLKEEKFGLTSQIRRAAVSIPAKYGLDKPWYVQYGKMMWNVLRLDFGNSLKYENETVNDILRRTLPVSATIGLLAYLLALVVGVFTGTLAALRPNSKLDYVS